MPDSEPSGFSELFALPVLRGGGDGRVDIRPRSTICQIQATCDLRLRRPRGDSARQFRLRSNMASSSLSDPPSSEDPEEVGRILAAGERGVQQLS